MAPDNSKVIVENVNHPGHTERVDAVKYEAVREAMLRVLPVATPGMTGAEMNAAVKEHLPQDLFPGGAKAGWWCKCVQLDLEAKGLMRRETVKPLRFHKV